MKDDCENGEAYVCMLLPMPVTMSAMNFICRRQVRARVGCPAGAALKPQALVYTYTLAVYWIRRARPCYLNS